MAVKATFELGAGKPLGLGLKHAGQGINAIVTGVKPVGAAAKWNEANPDSPVAVGQVIRSIGGQDMEGKGYREIISAFKSYVISGEPFIVVFSADSEEEEEEEQQHQQQQQQQQEEEEAPQADEEEGYSSEDENEYTVAFTLGKGRPLGLAFSVVTPLGLGVGITNIKSRGEAHNWNAMADDEMQIKKGDRIVSVDRDRIGDLPYADIMAVLKETAKTGQAFSITFTSTPLEDPPTDEDEEADDAAVEKGDVAAEANGSGSGSSSTDGIRQIVVSIELAQGQKLGMLFGTRSNGDGVIVTEIKPGGAAEQWNKEHPEAEIMPGSLIAMIQDTRVDSMPYRQVMPIMKRNAKPGNPFQLRLLVSARAQQQQQQHQQQQKEEEEEEKPENPSLRKVTLPNAKGKSLGMAFKPASGSKGALVDKVKDSGAASEWNAANPDATVAPGDRIVMIANKDLAKKAYSDIISALKKVAGTGKPFVVHFYPLPEAEREEAAAAAAAAAAAEAKTAAAKATLANKSSTSPQKAAAAATDGSIEVLLPNAKGKSLGMGFKPAKGSKGALVDKIKSEGAASEWNAANPDATIELGHRISHIAGADLLNKSYSDIINALKKAAGTGGPFTVHFCSVSAAASPKKKAVATPAKKTSAAAAASTPAPATGRQDAIEVLLPNAKGKSLGMGFKPAKGSKGALVDKIKSEGAASEWNAANPDATIELGHRISHIAGADLLNKSYSDIINALKKAAGTGGPFTVHFCSVSAAASPKKKAVATPAKKTEAKSAEPTVLDITLPNTKGKSLGMAFKPAKGSKGCVVDKIKSKGAASEWNAANSDAPISLGDQIVSIAGVELKGKSYSDIISALKKAAGTGKPFSMSLQLADPSTVSRDLSGEANAKDAEPEEEKQETAEPAAAAAASQKPSATVADERHVDFAVELRLGKGRPLGLGLRQSGEGKGATVNLVKPTGVSAEWNTANPDKQICKDQEFVSIGSAPVQHLGYRDVIGLLKTHGGTGLAFEVVLRREKTQEELAAETESLLDVDPLQARSEAAMFDEAPLRQVAPEEDPSNFLAGDSMFASVDEPAAEQEDDDDGMDDMFAALQSDKEEEDEDSDPLFDIADSADVASSAARRTGGMFSDVADADDNDRGGLTAKARQEVDAVAAQVSQQEEQEKEAEADELMAMLEAEEKPDQGEDSDDDLFAAL